MNYASRLNRAAGQTNSMGQSRQGVIKFMFLGKGALEWQLFHGKVMFTQWVSEESLWGSWERGPGWDNSDGNPGSGCAVLWEGSGEECGWESCNHTRTGWANNRKLGAPERHSEFTEGLVKSFLNNSKWLFLWWGGGSKILSQRTLGNKILNYLWKSNRANTIYVVIATEYLEFPGAVSGSVWLDWV